MFGFPFFMIFPIMVRIKFLIRSANVIVQIVFAYTLFLV